MRLMLASSNVGIAYADLERTEKALQASELDWQAVRPTTLTRGSAGGHIITSERFGLLDSISREDVAMYMLGELQRTSFTLRTPLITSTR
jgi:uncharacterized protein YbjT (DUF2867 family)